MPLPSLGQVTFPFSAYFTGTVSAAGFSLPAGFLTDAMVGANSGSGNGVKASKLQHQYNDTYWQASANTVASDQAGIKVVFGAAGTCLSLKACIVTPAVGASTVVIDLWKNGVSVLTGTITIDNSKAAYVLTAAAGFLAGGVNLIAGDVLEVKITATVGGGTLPKGLIVQLVTTEDAA